MRTSLKALVFCFAIVYVAGQEGPEIEEGRTLGRPFTKVAGAIAHGIGHLLLDGDYQPYYRPPYNNYYNRPGFGGYGGYGGGFGNHYYRPGFHGYRGNVFDYK